MYMMINYISVREFSKSPKIDIQRFRNKATVYYYYYPEIVVCLLEDIRWIALDG